MPAFSNVAFRAVLVAAAYGLTWHAQPAVAQCKSTDQPLWIEATPAAKCARYYAPYALQAAAAYISVAAFDGTLRNFTRSDNPFQSGGDPSLNGADVALAVSPYTPDEETTGRAWAYLKAWQYQFGSDSYLTCYDTSDANCMNAYRESGVQPFSQGPAFQVWARTRYPHVEHDACSEVSIAFRGTVGSSGADWETNGEPVTQAVNWVRSFVSRRNYETDDYYHQLRRNIDTIIKRITKLDCYRRAARRPQVVTVGHSLGGGLAQFVALAATKDPATKEPRIAKVFAFDSSPVIAAGLIDPKTRDENAKGLEIDRVYQTGEGLSALVNPVVGRFQFASVYSNCNPLIRYVEFKAVPGSGPIEKHSIREGSGLAAQIVSASYNDQTQLDYKPPATTGCTTRYRAPGSDEDTVPVPSINPVEQVFYAPDGSLVRSARVDQKKASNLFASEPKISNTSWTWTEGHPLATPPTAKKSRRIHTAHL
jgi:hypothetical protein